ncbi:hypothetical protein B0H19DRAFT_1310282 [Mycena capillaripes]|nr:hypothetical protein B0H19DRAFT_1310282 [Mycena capillaripes]
MIHETSGEEQKKRPGDTESEKYDAKDKRAAYYSDSESIARAIRLSPPRRVDNQIHCSSDGRLEESRPSRLLSSARVSDRVGGTKDGRQMGNGSSNDVGSACAVQCLGVYRSQCLGGISNARLSLSSPRMSVAAALESNLEPFAKLKQFELLSIVLRVSSVDPTVHGSGGASLVSEEYTISSNPPNGSSIVRLSALFRRRQRVELRKG